MAQNRTSTDFPGTSGSQTGTTGTTGSTSENTGFSSGPTGSTGSTGTTGSTGSSAGTATALAQEYGSKITEVATQAKDYVSDKVSVVGDKLKDLQNVDYGEMAENAKDYARKNPG